MLNFKLMVFEGTQAVQAGAKRLPNSVMMAVPSEPDEFLAMNEARKLLGPCRLVTLIDVTQSDRQGDDLEMYRPFFG